MRFCNPNSTRGHYEGRISRYRIDIFGCPQDTFWVAKVVFVDIHGSEHETGYRHPLRPRDKKDQELAAHQLELVSAEINAVADEFNKFLAETGQRFEFAHPDGFAPDLTGELPYFGFDLLDEIQAV